jgi:hypothetical protein
MNIKLQEVNQIAEFMKVSPHVQQMSRIVESMRVLPHTQEMSRIVESMKVPPHIQEMSRIVESMKMPPHIQEMSRIVESMKMPTLAQEISHIVEFFKEVNTPKGKSRVTELLKIASTFQENTDNVSNIRIDADGEICFGNSSISSDRIIAAIEAAVDPLEKSINKAIDNIILEIKSLKEPVAQKIFILYIWPLIAILLSAVIQPVSDFYIKEKLTSNTKKAILKETKEFVTNNIYTDRFTIPIKIVTANNLVVRSSNSTKSEKIGILYFGSIVEVIEKKRDWCLVSWIDDRNALSLKGWVFSRYLTSLK